MSKDLQKYKDQIVKTIHTFLANQDVFWSVSRWGKDVIESYKLFVPKGKLIRSNLALITAEYLGAKDAENLLPVAASLEFFHSSLLIHDDFIDKDDMRRGQPSIPAMYREKTKAYEPHLGNSLAICAGDIGFFFGYSLMANSNAKPELIQKIIALTSQEMALVGQAEMEDTYLGYDHTPITKDAILSVYTYKTARYTFSLPLMMGAMMAESNQETIDCLKRIGESIGILFQIKDDEIGLIGDQKKIGKPIGSDILANKQTLFAHHLFALASNEDKDRLKEIFGNQKSTQIDIEFVLDKMKEYGVFDEINTYANSLAKSIKVEIAKIEDKNLQNLLTELLQYNLDRTL